MFLWGAGVAVGLSASAFVVALVSGSISSLQFVALWNGFAAAAIPNALQSNCARDGAKGKNRWKYQT